MAKGAFLFCTDTVTRVALGQRSLLIKGHTMKRLLLLSFVLLLLLQFWVFSQQPAEYEQSLAKAATLINSAHFADAAKECGHAIKIDSARYEGYLLYAKAYQGQGLLDDAIGYLQSALARAPEDKKVKIRDAIAEIRQVQAEAGSRKNPQTPDIANQPANPTSATAPPTQAEIILWTSIENSKKLDDFKVYLEKYSNGTFAGLAKRRVDELEAPIKLHSSIAGKWVCYDEQRNIIGFRDFSYSEPYLTPNPHGDGADRVRTDGIPTITTGVDNSTTTTACSWYGAILTCSSKIVLTNATMDWKSEFQADADHLIEREQVRHVDDTISKYIHDYNRVTEERYALEINRYKLQMHEKQTKEEEVITVAGKAFAEYVKSHAVFLADVQVSRCKVSLITLFSQAYGKGFNDVHQENEFSPLIEYLDITKKTEGRAKGLYLFSGLLQSEWVNSRP